VGRLEERVVAAAGLGASLSGGVLRVAGTDGPDAIELRALPPQGARVRGAIELAGVGRFPAARIKSVTIDSGAGGDEVRVSFVNRGTRPPAVAIDAGAGDDRVCVSRMARAGARVWIEGGDGDDTIEFTIKQPRRIGVDGGAGLDTINGVREPGAPRVSAQAPVEVALSAWEQAIVDLTNSERARAGLPALRVNGRLVEAARLQAGQMSHLDRMAHTLPDAGFPALLDRLRHVGYTAGAGENIAFNYRDPADVLLGWMYSPAHRENILRSSFREIGVAVALNAEGLPYFVQVFGTSAA
jgi:uncharacterized protein YkwD